MNQCFECGKETTEEHHVIPRIYGGTQTISLCSECHGKVHSVRRQSLSELIKAALAAKKAQGFKLGNPANLTAKAWQHSVASRKRAAKENPSNLRALAIATDLRAQKMSYAKIAAKLNEYGLHGSHGGKYHAVTVSKLLALYQA